MVIRRCNVGPSAASQSPKDAPECDEAWQLVPRLARHEIPESDESESRTRGYGNEELEKGSFGIAIAYCRGDGGEPFLWVAEPFVLDDLVVVEGHANDESTQEGRCEEERNSQSRKCLRARS